MMRTIKFRGLGVGNDMYKDKFVYGSLILCEDDIESTIINDEFESQVLTDSVGEFIGIIDKNGMEIYEGDVVDICRHKDENSLYQLVVKDIRNIPMVFYGSSFTWSEIIGNIHENNYK